MYCCESLITALSTYCKWECLPRELLVDATRVWQRGSKKDGQSRDEDSAVGAGAAAATDAALRDIFLRALASTVPLEWTVECVPELPAGGGLSEALAATARGPAPSQIQAQQQRGALQRQHHQQQQQPWQQRQQRQQQQLLPPPLQQSQQRPTDRPYHAAATSTSASKVSTMYAVAVGTHHGLVAIGGMSSGTLTQLRMSNEASKLQTHEPAMLSPDLSRVFQAGTARPSQSVVRVSAAAATPAAVAPAATTRAAPGRRRWHARPLTPALSCGLVGHSVVLHGGRALIWGGMEASPAQRGYAAVAADERGGGGSSMQLGVGGTVSATRPSNQLRAYALTPSATQGGLLPVLSESLPQLGELPSPRAYHSATLDPAGAGVMYVLGGVGVRQRDGARVPADTQPGTLHRYCLYSYRWSTLCTRGAADEWTAITSWGGGGACPRSTTLLAFFYYDDALWAIPDEPSSRERGSAHSRCAQAYRLLRLDLATLTWHKVETRGQPPAPRRDACCVLRGAALLVYGGRTRSTPSALLSDLVVLQLDRHPPSWESCAPRLLPCSTNSGANGTVSCILQQPPAPTSSLPGNQQHQQQQQQHQHQRGLLPLAGHAGAADMLGRVLFFGGCRRADVHEPSPVLQVLQIAVCPATPDAATWAPPLALALQHARLQLARVVRAHAPSPALLRSECGACVRLPARLLALHSALFDEMFQELLLQGGGGGGDIGEQQQSLPEVPLPGVSHAVVASLGRWMMGLQVLPGRCTTDQLTQLFRAADQLAMDSLMVEVLQALAAAGDAASLEAAAQLLGGGGADGPDCISAAMAPVAMEIGVQRRDTQLQARCEATMRRACKTDAVAALHFAARFALPHLQEACLAQLGRTSHDGMGLLSRAGLIVQVAGAHPAPDRLLGLLQLQLLNEAQDALLLANAGINPSNSSRRSSSGARNDTGRGDLAANSSSSSSSLVDVLLAYAAAAQSHGLLQLQQGLAAALAEHERWELLQTTPQVLQQLQQCYPELLAAADELRARRAAYQQQQPAAAQQPPPALQPQPQPQYA